MHNFSSYQKRKAYYDNNQKDFDSKLEKMWRIWCEKEGGHEPNFSVLLSKKLKDDCISKVWLNSKKVFDIKKMPIDNMLFADNEQWWLGQIVGKKHIKHEKQRHYEKEKQWRDTKILEEEVLQRMNPYISKISKTIIAFKKHCNLTMLSAWFHSDRKDPVVLNIFNEIILPTDKTKKVENFFHTKFQKLIAENISLSNAKEIQLNQKMTNSKKTLMVIAAHFRFYYLGKNTVECAFFKSAVEQKKLFEEAYLKPCEEGKLVIKDKVISNIFNLEIKQVKNIRKVAANHVLSEAKEDDNSSNISLDFILSRRIWKYTERNIAESLSIGKTIEE